MPEITQNFELPPSQAKPGRNVFSVTSLTKDIKNLLETGFDSVWVKGEISSFKKPGSGHFYFTLKDEKSNLNCVMFRFKNQYLKFDVEEGLEVICGGRITVYEPRGSYQLLIDQMEPVGLGALQLQFEKLKEKLSKEGLFDAKHKKPIPYLPQKIAIITSPTGAAIRDMLNVLNRRFSNVEILLIPASVQGDKAPQEIASAIQIANQMNEHDVILLGRGGGSLEDLWSFNEEIVARAIFESKIPIISCVGHEVDFTISDFVADLRAPTPSAAAELVVKNKVDLQKQVLNQMTHLRQAYLSRIQKLKHRLSEFSGRIIDPRRNLQDWRLRMADLQERLSYTLLQNIKDAKNRFERITSNLPSEINYALEQKRQNLKNLRSILSQLNPLTILERGYSITHLKNKIIRTTQEVQKNDEISVQLFKGTLICTVKDVKA
ncbi:MAG: hypothetical protein A3B70_04470 [Deltaproteobacteria bacterium RIFCSPHIGHO2_02_FULL_40_11]|nr:MAG: hypothetical protein A3B70_04470 [Deltaproteobacteria bacterium RIFCSPHIGHO2_02_FULL_40_11]